MSSQTETIQEYGERYEQGLARLMEIDGAAGKAVVETLGAVCPDLARYVIEFPFGDVYARPEMGLREREIAVIASLTTLRATPQLKVHVRAGLNVGLTREEILETILTMAVYAGFPAAITAALAAGEVFAEDAGGDTPDAGFSTAR